MISFKRLEAGKYKASDGRSIFKIGSSWYVLNTEGKVELGDLPTLKIAKEYVTNGSISLSHHNKSITPHSKKQSKKEFNAYLVSEAKNGNSAPIIIWFIIMFIIGICTIAVRGY